MRDTLATVIWLTLAATPFLAWYGFSRRSPTALLAGGTMALVAALPLSWSIGPFLYVFAAVQLAGAAAFRWSFQWWQPVVAVAGATALWLGVIVGAATLLE